MQSAVINCKASPLKLQALIMISLFMSIVFFLSSFPSFMLSALTVFLV